MVSQAATSLKDQLAQKMREMDEALSAFDETTAVKRPAEGAWCAKELLSHLMGEEGEGIAVGLRRFLDEDVPLIGVVSGLPYFTPARQAMSLKDLREGVFQQYNEVAEFVGGLGDEQLARKARIPLLKDTPFGEEVSMAQWAGIVINFHLADHVNQIKQIAEA